MRTTQIDNYIYEVIVPRYAVFDAAHKEDHAQTVINQAMKLLDEMPQEYAPVDREILKMAADALGSERVKEKFESLVNV